MSEPEHRSWDSLSPAEQEKAWRESGPPPGYRPAPAAAAPDRRTAKMAICAGFATVFAYLAPPTLAMLWAAVAIVLAVLVLVLKRPGKVPAIVVLIFAALAVLWTLARL